MTRLATGFWVQAYLARLRQYEIPAFVTAHGDDTAGVVLIKLNRLDGTAALFTRRYDMMFDTRSWECLTDGAEADSDALILREQRTDPDLWVIEVEDRRGRHLLDQGGLE